jgi:hypothetical protein
MMTGAEGTFNSDILPGKDAYANNNNLPIDTRFIPALADNPPIPRLMDVLDAGGDVEIIVRWDSNRDGKVDDKDKGGHMAMVTGIALYGNGQYQLSFVDDAKQGNGKAENNEHVIMGNPDGTFSRNPDTGLAGGEILGFVAETLQGAKVGAARFSLFNPLSTDTASAPATRFLRSLSFGRWIGTVGFPVSMRQPAGMNPSAMGIGQNHLLPPVGLTR